MSWIFTPITVAAGKTKADPTEVRLRLVVGRVRKLVVFMPATTNTHEAGIRVAAPRGPIFPTRAHGSDDWIYSYKFGYKEVFEMQVDLEEVAPVHLFVQGHNSDNANFLAQIGIYIEPWHTDVEKVLHQIKVGIEAMKRASAIPDLEKQFRCILKFLFGGNDDERSD